MKTQQQHWPWLAPRVNGIDSSDILWLLMMSAMLFTLLLPFSCYVAFIQDEWGRNNTQAGTIFSAYLTGYAISALVVIPLGERE